MCETATEEVKEKELIQEEKEREYYRIKNKILEYEQNHENGKLIKNRYKTPMNKKKATKKKKAKRRMQKRSK